MNSRDPAHSDVEAAIARVLAAEAAAVLAVRSSEIEAQQSLEAARARARRISEHTSERLQRISLRIEADCAREIAQISATAAEVAVDFEHDVERLNRVVAVLAADLTGGQG